MEQIAVFRTGRPYEVLLVLDELKQAQIPAFGQEIHASGMVLAMPPSPIPHPGTSWVVRVPQVAAPDALSLIESLPVDADQEPDFWHSGPTPQAKMFFTVAAVLTLALMAFGAIGTLFDLL